jgi:hypothetical protein
METLGKAKPVMRRKTSRAGGDGLADEWRGAVLCVAGEQSTERILCH